MIFFETLSCLMKLSLKMKGGKVPQSNLIVVVKFKFERMFVLGFFSNSFVTCHKEIGYLFSIVRRRIVLFVALSHCDKQIICLLHWVTVTNKVCICSGKKPKNGRKMLNFWSFLEIFGTFCYFLGILFAIFCIFSKNSTHFGIFCAIYTNFFAVTQCDKQKIYLSQWLSATNKSNHCHSDSVRQTILKKNSNLFVASDKGIGKKPKNKHPFKFEFHHRYQITLGYLECKMLWFI